MSTIRIVLSICNSCVTCSIGPAGYAVIMVLFMMVPWEFTVVTWPRTQQNKLATVPLLLIYNMVGLEEVLKKKKKKSLSNFFLTFLKFSYLMSLWKNTIKIYTGHLACSRVKDYHTSLPGPWIKIQNRVLQMHPCSFPWILDFYAQYWMRSAKLRNHLKVIFVVMWFKQVMIWQ